MGDVVGVRDRSPLTSVPVVEVFGPTIQGEGALAGVPTAFVRFGGCDYRCEWCDSLHAVIPEAVREARRMTTAEVAAALDHVPGPPTWVTLSGGNPALLELGDLVTRLHRAGRQVAVETQGSIWRDWLSQVDLLTVSPKPPSSGMASSDHEAETRRFLRQASGGGGDIVLKIVIFDEVDYTWARALHQRWNQMPFYLSCGTDPPRTGTLHADTLRGVSDRYRWLCERAARDPVMGDARILPQLHVLAWGHEKGR